MSPISSRNRVAPSASSNFPPPSSEGPGDEPFPRARRAVDLEGGGLGSGGEPVDRAGGELFAGAVLSRDENARVGRRHPGDLLAEAPQRRRLPQKNGLR